MPLAVEVAYCHHMRDDGLGYPVPALPILPGPITNIIQVADMFEALTAHRPYHQPLSAEEAVGCILSTKGMQSKRAALGLLLQRLTNSPPGSEVTLRSGERCLVIRSFADRPDHPLVRVLANPDGTPVAEPHDIDLREAAAEEERPIREVHLKPSILRTGRESARDALVKGR